MAKYIVGSRKNQEEGYSIAPSPKIHTSLDTANKEAIRLASLHQGTTFVVLSLASAHKVEKVTQVPI